MLSAIRPLLSCAAAHCFRLERPVCRSDHVQTCASPQSRPVSSLRLATWLRARSFGFAGERYCRNLILISLDWTQRLALGQMDARRRSLYSAERASNRTGR